MTTKQFVRDKKAADILGLKPQTLRNWRAQGKGPPYMRVMGRVVVYDPTELIKWAERFRVETQDSEAPA